MPVEDSPATIAAAAAETNTPAVAEGAQTLDMASTLMFPGQSDPADQSQTTPPTQSIDGQAQAAPVNVEGDGTGKPKEDAGAAPAEGQAAPEASDADVLALMSPTELPEQTLARTKREAGASRAEALRLKKVDDSTREVLKSQGIELVLDSTGTVIGVAPTKDYNGGKSEEVMSLKFTEMSEAQQTQFESDPQALINHVLSHARTGMARVAPTVEKPFASISQENEQATFDHVAGLVLEDGVTKKHPNLAINKAIIHQIIDAPSNAALKAFYHQQPDLALALLDSNVDKTRTLLASKAQLLVNAANKKKQEADATLSTAPAGGGSPVITTGGSSPEEVGQAWGKAIALAE